ncbi:histone-like nucleoid-structuring protein H-NS [Roseivivax marinus]|jgi:DNA-binding protein H-NS|uniref:Histone-like nucleoid-structuring protein H-NS n=1 Tax=Roseivivax marinus TaxID=1379903 RepID=W4HN36_9RHOB|nr:H-NS histone family protein [Roseivivax marinus]ETW13526.1 histone-like nucleoid-structuring protein H-NS [Roseivivax marinus]UMA65112.1 H-NS histone family protein [Roseivivax marinus]SEK57645.1 DNA-binding protein H-NS [Roseivivax marinus]
MDIDLEQYSKEDLRKLKADVERALKTIDARRKAEAKRAAEHAAKEYGFSLDDLIVEGGGKASKGIPRYKNPEDPSQTWTGRGRKPNWVISALDDGKTLDDLKI